MDEDEKKRKPARRLKSAWLLVLAAGLCIVMMVLDQIIGKLPNAVSIAVALAALAALLGFFVLRTRERNRLSDAAEKRHDEEKHTGEQP